VAEGVGERLVGLDDYRVAVDQFELDDSLIEFVE